MTDPKSTITRNTKLAMAPLALALLVATASPAEIYSWSDADGQLRFSDDASAAPAAARAEARAPQSGPTASTGSFQRFERSAFPVSTMAFHHRVGAGIVIPFEREGEQIVVQVKLNDRVVAPFAIDTTARDVTLPTRVAVDLGLAGGPCERPALTESANAVPARTQAVETAQDIVKLRSVEIGGSQVYGIETHIDPDLAIGRLGTSFFNNFNYFIDDEGGVIVLEPVR